MSRSTQTTPAIPLSAAWLGKAEADRVGKALAGREHLRSLGVLATFHYVPLHSSPFGRELGTADLELPLTDRIAASLLRLPPHPLLGPDDVDRVIDAVRSFRP